MDLMADFGEIIEFFLVVQAPLGGPLPIHLPIAHIMFICPLPIAHMSSDGK